MEKFAVKNEDLMPDSVMETYFYDPDQKLQVGSVCRVIRGPSMAFPPMAPTGYLYYGLTCLIVGSKFQICGSNGIVGREDGSVSVLKETLDYCVAFPPELNPQCYNSEGDWEWKGEWSTAMRMSSWLDSDQLVLVRNPTEKEYLLAVELLVQQRQKQIRHMEEKELTNIYRKWR